MKVTARNQSNEKSLLLKKAQLTVSLRIDIGGGHVVTANISLAAIEELGLEVGKDAYAIIKASLVMVGVDD